MEHRRRSRSRSPERHYQDARRKRSRSRSPDRRYQNDGYNRDNNTRRNPRESGKDYGKGSSRGNDTHQDIHSISASVQDQMMLLKQKASNKLAKEQLKQERLALIKNITETADGNLAEAAPMEDNENEEQDEEAEMRKFLGFDGFNTTKGKEVLDNHAGAVASRTSREYRQYMNRKGGFNRPLDKA